MRYTIDEHKHRFAVWAASRAASVKGCRFSIEQGKAVLEAVGMKLLITDPNNLPAPENIDTAHREWRKAIINAATSQGLNFTVNRHAKMTPCEH